MYASQASKLRAARRGKDEEELRQALERSTMAAAQAYSLFVNALLYLIAFALLAAGLLSGLPTFMYFTIDSLLR